VADSCEHGNEYLGSIKIWEFLEWLSDCWLLEKDSAPWSWLVGWLVGWLVCSVGQLIVGWLVGESVSQPVMYYISLC
jgi:hypothetical protein